MGQQWVRVHFFRCQETTVMISSEKMYSDPIFLALTPGLRSQEFLQDLAGLVYALALER